MYITCIHVQTRQFKSTSKTPRQKYMCLYENSNTWFWDNLGIHSISKSGWLRYSWIQQYIGFQKKKVYIWVCQCFQNFLAMILNKVFSQSCEMIQFILVNTPFKQINLEFFLPVATMTILHFGASYSFSILVTISNKFFKLDLSTNIRNI